MLTVTFYNPATVPHRYLAFAVIGARWGGQWVFCRHQARTTYEFPGGHREPGETIEEAARRELYEETGALAYTLAPVCAYSVTGANSVNPSGRERFGMLFRAEITQLGPLPGFEIRELAFGAEPPGPWTYPAIQPRLLERL